MNLPFENEHIPLSYDFWRDVYKRQYIRSVCLSFLTVFILLYFATAVMGKSAVIRNFPFYSFFQISKFGTFERLDVLHISFWIMGVFVKTVTALYCASSCISKKPKRSFVFASSFIVFVISVLILKLSGGQGVNYEFTMILFFVFCVIIPLGTLVFKKKNYGCLLYTSTFTALVVFFVNFLDVEY